MNLPKISGFSSTQAAAGLQTSASQDESGSSGGWKYITVQDGNVQYTYIVIGKNMKVLVGKTDISDKNDDKQKQTAKDNKTAPETTQSPFAAADTETAKPDFLTDLRMFALTGAYQKKCRETLKALEQQIGDEGPDSPVKTSAALQDSKL